LAGSVFAQTGNALLGGTVQDPTNALIPGVTITAKNVATGVTLTRLTNESGTYNFPVLQPGTYEVSAELAGFKKALQKNVELPYAGAVRIDFTLELGAAAQTVEVVIAGDSILRESSASVGDVLTQDRVQSLPLVGNNVLDLLSTLPGISINPDGEYLNTVAGLSINTINSTRDGLPIGDDRQAANDPSYRPGYKAFSPTTLVPDMVGEIRLILSPVDAELGRGNAQIQIRTRSGTNKYNGSATWSVRNTALDANTWVNNHTIANGKPTPLDWNNNNQFTLAYGGPVRIPGLYDGKNKTFFYTVYEQNIHNTRDTTNVNVLTDAARLGIFRYWTGYNPVGWNSNQTGIVNPTFPINAGTASAIAVDINGNPVAPARNPDGSPYSGKLVCFSVFGARRLDNNFNFVPFTAQDCPGGSLAMPSTSDGLWDRFRPAQDTTGYIKKVLSVMPRANWFGSNDGLNIGQYRWQRRRDGSNGLQAVIGADLYSNNKQINLKIDHNISAQHKVAVSWTRQRDNSADNVASYPGGPNGVVIRRPDLVTANVTSTISSRMINEARFGMNRVQNYNSYAFLHLDDSIRQRAEEFLLPGSVSTLNPNYTYKTVIGNYATLFGAGNNMYMATAGNNAQTFQQLFNYADTLSWTRGKHAFKFGVEYRHPATTGNGQIQPYPAVTIGNNASATATTSPFGTVSNFAAELPGLLNTAVAGATAARTNVTSMLYWLSGSVSGASQQYWLEGFGNVQSGLWEDTSTKGTRYRTQIHKEWASFVKDDYKITRRLTLNLGVRWEYYASPYITSGLTTQVIDFGSGLFGPARATFGSISQFNADPFSIFMKPGGSYLTGGGLYLTGYGSSATNPLSCEKGVQQNALLPVSTCDPNLLTGIRFVGPNSPNPDVSASPERYANIGPAVGFAYQLPWFGQGKTTIRGGYQQTFGAGNVSRGFSNGGTEGIFGNAPGATNVPSTAVADAAFQAILATRALTLADIPALTPVRPTAAPGAKLPIYGRSALAPTTFDPNYKDPYTQNVTLSITRQVQRNLTVDVRWTGTYARRQIVDLNLNTNNVYHNPELFQALTDARAGTCTAGAFPGYACDKNGDPILLDQMLAGLNLNTTATGFAAVGTNNTAGVFQSGAAHMRRSATFAANLANGDFAGVADSMLTLAPTGLRSLPSSISGVSGNRTIRNGCDRLADGFTIVQQSAAGGAQLTNTGAAIPLRCFPEDFMISNPQFATLNYRANLNHSNYNALQAQVTARPTNGISLQATWAWAKSMQLSTTDYLDPADRNLNFTRGNEAVHTIRANGTIELPIGPNKLLFSNTSGWVARALERWQTSFILNKTTGFPFNIIPEAAHMYRSAANGGSRYNIVSNNWAIPHGDVQWDGPDHNSGTYYGNPGPFISTLDPQCRSTAVSAQDAMGTNLQASCTMNALASRNANGSVGELLLVNTMPGQVGNLQDRSLLNFGRWDLDASASKTFRVSESRNIQVRIDAQNVMNHPTPSGFGTSVTTLGVITSKAGSRQFQGQLRLNF
jgi:hypothetical protein